MRQKFVVICMVTACAAGWLPGACTRIATPYKPATDAAATPNESGIGGNDTDGTADSAPRDHEPAAASGGGGAHPAGGAAGEREITPVAGCGASSDAACAIDPDCAACPDGLGRERPDCDLPCTPILLGLGVNPGVLEPALDTLTTQYRIQLPLLANAVRLTPLAAASVQIELDGRPVASAAELAIEDVPVGETTRVVTLRHPNYGSRTYALTIARGGRQVSYLKASNADANDEFGFSLAVDGDTLVVGARYEDSAALDVNGDQTDNGAADSGAAYVFKRTGNSFEQTAYLKPATLKPGASFGWAVALHADTIAVGAPETNGGAVYVFTRSGDTWRASATLTSNEGGGFGKALALHGDTLVAGAPGENAGASQSGATHVFQRDGDSWPETAHLKPTAPFNTGWSGGSVAYDGDIIVAGGTGEDVLAGGAYLFQRNGQGFKASPRIVASTYGPGQLFAVTAALNGQTLAIGGFGVTRGAMGSGAVFVFERDGAGVRETAVLAAGNPTDQAHCGEGLAYRGDTLIMSCGGEDSSARGINGDVSGAPLEDSGAAYVFVNSAGTWKQLAHIKPEVPRAGQNFGSTLALSGDTLFIGARSDSSGARGVGGDATDNRARGSGAVFVVR